MKPAPYNPRKISENQLKMLKKSMKEFGDLSGIIVNKKTGNIIGGHQRIKAMGDSYKINGDKITSALGEFIYREVEWDEQKEKLANIAANKQGGEWDIVKLEELFIDIDVENIDIDLIGFNINEIEDIFSEPEEKEEPGAGTNEIEDYKYQVVVTCADECEQIEIIEKLEKEGLKCQPLIL